MGTAHCVFVTATVEFGYRSKFQSFNRGRKEKEKEKEEEEEEELAEENGEQQIGRVHRYDGGSRNGVFSVEGRDRQRVGTLQRKRPPIEARPQRSSPQPSPQIQLPFQLKNSLLLHRRKLIEAIDEYTGEDPLKPWIECIKWVQEAFPPGGDCSGLIVMYEQCARQFWHDDRYKDDLRYLKVWLEYAENCVDAEVIYNFLEANNIGLMHASFYISYGLLMEQKNKNKTANEIFNRGISIKAEPLQKLTTAYKKFLARSMRQLKTTDEDATENHASARSFGTVLTEQKRNHMPESSDIFGKKQKPDRAPGSAFSIFKRQQQQFYI